MNLQRFRVATFNLYNLQLPGRRMNPGQRPWTDGEFARKIAWTAGRLRALDADIVGLQELWHRDAAAAVLEAAGMADEYDLVADAADGGHIVTAALVRKGLLVGEAEWIERFPEALRLESNTPHDPQAPGIRVSIPRFARPVLRLRVALRDDHPHTEVYVVHLKSKLPIRIDTEPWFEADPDAYRFHTTAIGAALATIQRTAEATALRVLLTQTMKGTVTPVIVLGDINDGQHSNTVNILTEQPNYLVGDSRGGADVGLYTAQTLQEYRDTRDVYYTHVHDDLRESLDHVLVSEQFYDNSKKRLWLFDGLSIQNDHLDDEDHRDAGTGDHGIVAVRFVYRPYRAR
ncbi:endonuclease/exonuclease/phosphatase family protein [Microbacterium hominis]|uniref:Endonuclease/exonuclease/phosphatase family protein n=1 Tax=Microbacterium hominis TaxID=162426 RepID=A0A7D4QKG8_9MICO|nr:endonuclease/exonuclease/phosphatase family protein [Microbacterium hominis]QKJ20456.1 endonuclease/exonuclease/phosphatase family protein [Microbacterium hominis]